MLQYKIDHCRRLLEGSESGIHKTVINYFFHNLNTFITFDNIVFIYYYLIGEKCYMDL